MTETIFATVDTIKFEGRESSNPLAYRWYEADRKILGKSMKEQLRWAVCYWHSFNWPGGDVFGPGALPRRPTTNITK